MAMKVDPARSAAAKAGWDKRRRRMAHEANCNLAISRGIAARNDAYKHKREIADEVMSIQDDIYEVSMFCAYEIHKIIQETPIKHLRRKYNASLWKRFRASFVYSMLYVSAEAFHRQQIVSMDIEDYRKDLLHLKKLNVGPITVFDFEMRRWRNSYFTGDWNMKDTEQ